MIAFALSAALTAVSPIPCPVPESMPALSEAMAGEGDADWCLHGADPFAIAGPDRPPRQLVSRASDGVLGQIIQWRRQGPGPVPFGWRGMLGVSARAMHEGDFYEILIQKAGDNLIVVTANPAWRIGNAVCAGEGGRVTVYLPARATPTAVDREAIDRLEGPSDIDPGNVMCTLLTPEGDGYRQHFRGPQGRPLYEIDGFYEDVVLRVTPPGDYERYLGITGA